jgi:hypothetical protein
MAFAEIALASQVLGGYFQSRSERKALNRQLDLLREQFEWEKRMMAGPLAAREYLAGELGKESPVMAAAHRERMQQLDVREAAAERRARGYGRRSGNVPGARGLKWAQRREFRQARTAESLGYGAGQEQRKLRVAGLLAGTGGGGGGGTAGAIASLLGQKGRVKSEWLGDIGEAFGTYQAGREHRQQQKAAAKKKDLPVAVDPRELGLSPGGGLAKPWEGWGTSKWRKRGKADWRRSFR